MYLRKGKTKNGKIHLSITQSYRNDKGQPTNKTIKTFGNLDALSKKWQMPENEVIKKCEKICKELNIPCQVFFWTGDKPIAGLEAAAREAKTMEK